MIRRVSVGLGGLLAVSRLAGFAGVSEPTPPDTEASAAAVSNSEITVTARRWQESAQSVPQSVTVLSGRALGEAGVATIRDAAPDVPNLTMPAFTARQLSFPFVRGIGSGRNAPAVTTYIDGVPQWSYATAGQELLDVDRIEFVRGPLGALYGRNALGGVINVVTREPAAEPLAEAAFGAGSYNAWDARGSVSGPVTGEGAPYAGASGGYARRDGYTVNDVTGDDLDDQSAWFGRAQVLWPDAGGWKIRLSGGGQSSRDGDFALGDLDAVRARPHHVAHDFEGYSDLDLAQPVLTLRRAGDRADVASTTAFQWWQLENETDLDATPADMLRRHADESQQVWIEDLRFSTPEGVPVALTPSLACRWLLGGLFFESEQDQRFATEYRSDAAAMLGVPPGFTSVDAAELNDWGLGVYGQGALILNERIELTGGLRQDHEDKAAELGRSSAPGVVTEPGRDFDRTTPQVSLGLHVTPEAFVYTMVSEGYKSGGFNAQSDAEHSAYGEETSLTVEAGAKTAWFGSRLTANGSVFRTDWDDLQLDVPVAGAPAAFYIDNAGQALSQGGELEIRARVTEGLEMFGGLGLLDTEFRPGSSSGGQDVGGHDLPFAPQLTWNAGGEFARPLAAQWRGSIGLDASGSGRFFYDASNAQAEDGYVLANARLGLEHSGWRMEGWCKNLFDVEYVPIALPYPQSPSGYVGEAGAPRTLGVALNRRF